MNLAGSVSALSQLAQEGEHHSQWTFNPLVIGLFGLGSLLLMLVITTRFNRDR